MWARFSSTGTCDVSKDLFTIATVIGANSRVHDLSSQGGIGLNAILVGRRFDDAYDFFVRRWDKRIKCLLYITVQWRHEIRSVLGT